MSSAARGGLPGLWGARALVTGGSRGIGRAVVRMLAEMGASVGFSYATDEAAAGEALADARSAGGRTEAAYWHEVGDLSVEEDVDRLFRRVRQEFGRLDVFVGNAGIWNEADTPIQRLEPAEWRRMMDVNLTSIYLTTRHAATCMEDGGRIVLISSTAGQRGEPGHSHYAATKGAIISFCKSLAGELGSSGITVNAVSPGTLENSEKAVPLEQIPAGRAGTSEDVAAAVLFLVSDAAAYVTGANLKVSGG